MSDHIATLRAFAEWMRGGGANPFAPTDGFIAIEELITEVEKLRISEKASHAVIVKWRGDRIEMVAEIDRLREIEKAAVNMCDVKGRHHSEMAMDRLMEVCGKAKK